MKLINRRDPQGFPVGQKWKTTWYATQQHKIQSSPFQFTESVFSSCHTSAEKEEKGFILRFSVTFSCYYCKYFPKTKTKNSTSLKHVHCLWFPTPPSCTDGCTGPAIVLLLLTFAIFSIIVLANQCSLNPGNLINSPTMQTSDAVYNIKVT